ncbi:MAG: AraC family transcriptional regulator [Candidatus Cloacimonetes bacterium]|nr:AraC family transcriptional regulator [Candidatus Cloacimonadota bacterium]
MSITEFIIQCKIRDAKRLLRYSEKTLCEISNYLCFSSQSYFQTVFKKDTSLTPSKYRQKHSVF